MMVLAGIENLIVFLVIGAFIVIPAIIKAARQAKEEAERNARSGKGGSGGGQKPKASSSTDELTAFLNSLSQKTSVGQPARRPQRPPAARPARPPEREARSARITADPKPLHAAAPIPHARVPSGPKRIPRRKARQPAPAKVAAAARAPVSISDRMRKTEERPAPVAVVPEQRAPMKAFGGWLPADPLQQAIVLREVLGPCRCRRRYRPGEW